ncbi:SRPBCC family protein [Oligoflexus tunisiensis]|uniref:SRPBCC family protein n=1 Tax=Oligoflexus tunisiensis TaxID=708132 RepID=UPI000A85018D|nr:SRPBCC family protein [Oligoflexus tunisiensis]
MTKNSAQKKKPSHTATSSAAVHMEQDTDILPTAEPSMQDYPETSKYNVSKGERIASGVIGGGLLMYGIPNFWTIPGQASSLTGAYLVARGLTGHCLIYSAFGIDSTPNGRMHHRGLTDPHPIQLRQTISIAKPVHEVYDFCRNQEHMARSFPTVKQVKKIDDHRSIWMFTDTAELVSFPVTVEITQESEGEQITWTAFPESQFRVNGTLLFRERPHEQETELTVTVHMIPPGGILGPTLMKWLTPFSQDALNEVLHRLKQVLETGTITTSQSRIASLGIKDPIGGWQNRFRTHVHVRTMQSLANRRIS